MIIKKISEDQVKVLIESADINQYKTPYHKLNIQDEDSIEFIYQLLFLIYEQTGVSFLENAVFVEARPAQGCNYFITFTRKAEEDEGILLQKEDLQEALYIYMLRRLEDLPAFLRALRTHKALLPHRCALYRMKESYYIILEYSPEQSRGAEFDKLLLILNEFAERCSMPAELDGRLIERGKTICDALPLDGF